MSNPWLRRLGLGFAAVLVVVMLATQWITSSNTAYSSPSPLPEATPNPNWVTAHDGGMRKFGTVTIVLPANFTEQGGATVIGNAVVVPVDLDGRDRLLPGTLFALGIWPPNDQSNYQKPIDLSFTLNSAQISPSTNNQVVVVQYSPSENRWIPLQSEFNQATFTVTANTQDMSPVAPTFPDWGGRTFFAIAAPDSATVTSAQDPTIARRANVRSGPGTSYAVLRVAKPGEPVTPIYVSPDGKWLMLEDQTWVAAFLIRNAPTGLPVFSSSSESSAAP